MCVCVHPSAKSVHHCACVCILVCVCCLYLSSDYVMCLCAHMLVHACMSLYLCLVGGMIKCAFVKHQ